MCGVTKLDRTRNERIRKTTKVGGNIQESAGRYVEVVQTCNEMWAIYDDVWTGEEKERKPEAEVDGQLQA